MLSTLRSEILNSHSKYLTYSEDLAESNATLKALGEEQGHLERALDVVQKAAKISQDRLGEHLSRIVTQAVQAVVGKPYEFVCEIVERRGSTEADLYLTKEGKKFDILDSTGGGVGDTCSFALKVAYLLLSNVDRVLVIDEVCRHINSKEQRMSFVAVMKRLVKEFSIQLIINSTIPELLEEADQVIRVRLTGNSSAVTEETKEPNET